MSGLNVLKVGVLRDKLKTLDLAIAKSIIDLHGGELNIEIDGDLFKVTITL